MRFEISERIRSNRSEHEIFSELMQQFKKVSTTTESDHQSFKAVDIEATFGSINRHDETTVRMKPMDDGWLLVADVLYRPSIAFWIILFFTLFSWVFWLVPLGFYLYQKKTVKAAIEACFARIKNEFEQPGHPGMAHVDSALDSIVKLGELREKGLISAEEYERKKKALLGEGPQRSSSPPNGAQAAPTPSFNASAFDRPAQPHPGQVLPPGIKGWSWGFFLLSFIWAIGNKTWIGLLALVPVLGLPVPFILGFKGREWAWKNKQWESVEHFNRVQRNWSRWGVGVILMTLSLYGVAFGIYAYNAAQKAAVHDQGKGMSDSTVEPRELEEAPQLAASHPAAPEERGEVNLFGDTATQFPTQLGTVAGPLELRSPEGGDQAVYLNQKPLFNGEDAKWQKIVKAFTLSNGSEAILMASSGGRGTSCETLFFFLVVSPNGAGYTPEFGTCASRLNYFKNGDNIRMNVPTMGGVSVYAFNGTTLLEDGKVKSMRDDIDPSK